MMKTMMTTDNKTSAMQRVIRIAIVLLLLAYAPTLWAQHRGRGSIAFDEVFMDLRVPGKLANEFPKDKFDMVRVLHLRGPLNSDDMRFVKRLAERSKVVNAKGDKVEPYLDLDMEEARLVRGGLLGGHSDSHAVWSSLFSYCRLLRYVILPRSTEEIGDRAFYVPNWNVWICLAKCASSATLLFRDAAGCTVSCCPVGYIPSAKTLFTTASG